VAEIGISVLVFFRNYFSFGKTPIGLQCWGTYSSLQPGAVTQQETNKGFEVP
jgi:hypothetical protein